MKDTIIQLKNLTLSHNCPPDEKFDWNPYVLLIATLSLIAAVIIPFAEKKYEEFKAKRSFKIYFKKQLGEIFNFLTAEKIEYFEPSIKNDPAKQQLNIVELTKRVDSDFKIHKNTAQLKIILPLLMNVHNVMHYSYQLRHLINRAKLDKLTEKTLEHGGKLSDKELKNVYGLVLVLEGFVSISLFHDRFGELKTVKRLEENNLWVGMKLGKDFLQKQHELNDDLQYLNDNEKSMSEITTILRVVEDKVREYFKQKD